MAVKTSFQIKGFLNEFPNVYIKLHSIRLMKEADNRFRKDTTFRIYESKESYEAGISFIKEYVTTTYIDRVPTEIFISSYKELKERVGGEDVTSGPTEIIDPETKQPVKPSYFALPASLKEIEEANNMPPKKDEIEELLNIFVEKLSKTFPGGIGQKIAIWTSFAIFMIFNMFVALAKFGIYDIFK